MTGTQASGEGSHLIRSAGINQKPSSKAAWKKKNELAEAELDVCYVHLITRRNIIIHAVRRSSGEST
jgi:hypothetical protein